MKIDGTEGIRIQRASITRYVKTEGGEAQQVTYRPGDPEFEDNIQLSGVSAHIRHTGTVLPLNFMMDAVGKDGRQAPFLAKEIDYAFEKYHNGITDEKAVEDVIANVVAELRSTYVDMGCNADEFMPKLLHDVYERAKASNIYATACCSFRDSRALAAQYNGSDRNSRDVIYYDAKYYYQSEEMKTTLQEITRRIGQRYGVSDLELSEGFTNPVAKGIYSSYNTVINEASRNDLLVGNMVDENMVPPKGFRFFYKGNDSGTNIYSPSLPSDGSMESQFDGILHVWYGDWSFTGRVPVRMDATRFPVSVNMYDTVASSGKRIPSEIVPALKNFDFFSMIQSGNYFASHPRKLPS